jgi:hypothetical protein
MEYALLVGGEIVHPFLEMCQLEGVTLQRGMNYELGDTHSVIQVLPTAISA